jgi:tetratricopeptide (TPR) repeat protein
MSGRLYLTLAALFLLAGCDLANCDDLMADDSHDPHLKQAQQDLDNNNPAAAASEYEAALAENPKLAGAEYQLGVLYSEKLQDPISSIYHLKRFLDLAPTNSDHITSARDLIDKESQAFAASVPNTNQSQMTSLQAENATLKKQVDDASNTITLLQTQLAQTLKSHSVVAAPAAAPTSIVAVDAGARTGTPAGPQRALPLDAPNPNPPANAAAVASAPGAPAPDAAGSRSYKVVKGDSIWKIAHKMYPGDTKNGVDKIQVANKDALGGKPLKIGQVLIIPQ